MNKERKMKGIWAILFFLMFFVGTACNDGSNANAEPTRPPVSDLQYQDFYAEATQCYTRLTGCEPGEENRIYRSYVGERVRWTNNVSFNKGNTLVLNNGQGTIALLNMPSETINNLKVGTELTVEGTIVPHSEYGWALDDVVMDIPAEPTPRPTTTPTSSGSYNITLEEDTVDVEYDRSNGDYKVSFWIENNGRKIARIYTSGCAYFEIDGSGEPTGEYICSQPPSWGSETVWIDPGKRGLAVFNYDNRTGKQAVQVCATLYNTIGYYDNGGTIIGEWKMDESLPCIHETN